MRRPILALIPLLLLPLARAAPAAQSTVAARVTAYLAPQAKTRYFSGSVIVEKGGTILLNKGYGLADEQNHVPDGPGTVFPIGSMTKAFTAAAILQLQDQHKLRVRDHFCKFVPGCPQAWKPITIDDLLTMTSGLPDFSFIPDEDLTSPQKMFSYLVQQKPDAPAGSTWAYNDFSYRFLGYIVQKLSHQSYDGYIRTHFFRPLGMTHSRFYADLLSVPKRAIPYPGAQVVPIPQHPLGTWPAGMTFFDAAGGIISTTADLLKWNQALDSTRLLSSADLHAMFSSHVSTNTPPDGPPFSAGYGYGWFIDTVYGQRVEQHRGGAGPYWGYTFRFPGEHMVMIVLSNRPDSDGDVIMTNLTRIVLGK
jgi:CubicO group peptidase (beta-lactamase class C family)